MIKLRPLMLDRDPVTGKPISDPWIEEVCIKSHSHHRWRIIEGLTELQTLLSADIWEQYKRAVDPNLLKNHLAFDGRILPCDLIDWHIGWEVSEEGFEFWEEVYMQTRQKYEELSK